uniref:Outer membrane efflux protein n=1 Tax=Candidatus Kentrum sp. FM TaxID=2126340 RepID=A0A450S8E0_9GAMM|nr:MAG: Outer membrane efflux protein [Candidatus Kentron sp. FM]VFK07977.1 MAG: Outer membrane efflux protein [Candidatus Kentron sp. FM]
MTNLYAWNTARAGSIAYPSVREARLFHPTRARRFFGLFDKPLPQQENAPTMMINLLSAMLLIAFSLGATKATAETLEHYTKRLADHPQVVEILEQHKYFKELADGEMGWPDPQLIIGIDNVPVDDPSFDRFLPTSKMVGFRQQIPNHSLREAKSEKQKRLSERQQLMADYTQRRLEAIFIGQLAERDKVKTLERLAHGQLKLYRAMEEDLKGRLEAGSPVYGRFSEIDVERAEILQRLNDLKAERVVIEEELIRLVGEAPTLPLPSVPEIPWHREPETLYPVRIAAMDVRVASKAVDAADAAFGPNYGIQALYKQRESGAGFPGDDWFSVQATVSIPLWSGKNQEPKLRAAKAGERKAQFAYEDTSREWVKRMAVLKAERDTARDNIVLLREKKTALQEMVKAAKRNYESGGVPLDTVLDAELNGLAIASQLAAQRSRHVQLAARFNSHIVDSHIAEVRNKTD